MNEPTPVYNIDMKLITYWQQIRREAVQIVTMAENNLIKLGAMNPNERKVITRKSKRRNA